MVRFAIRANRRLYSQHSASQPHLASPCFPAANAPLQPRHDRAQVASVLGEAPDVCRAADAEAGQRRSSTRSTCSPIPAATGCTSAIPEGYTATDIVCRAARMQGKSVMHPMGFDAFGLPAEEHAIKTGEHPRMQTEKNIATFRRQLKSLGFSLRLGPRAGDDRRRVLPLDAVDLPADLRHVVRRTSSSAAGRSASCRFPPTCGRQGDDAVRAYQDEHRLAYQTEAPVNWCPALGHGAGERRSDRRQERSAAATRSCGCRCGSGCCGSRPTPTGWKTIWKRSTGPRASKRCSAIGSAAARGRRSISSSATAAGSLGDAGDAIRRVANRASDKRVSRASPATTCCASTRRGPTRCSARRTW